MKFKTVLFAALLVVAPTFALAQGCSYDHSTKQVSSCADGFAWDSAAGNCVEQVTG